MTVQKIIHDPLSLSQPAAKAAASDRQAAQDLLDTLLARQHDWGKQGDYRGQRRLFTYSYAQPQDR